MRRKRGLSLRKNKKISRKINEFIESVGRILTLEEWLGIVKEYYDEGTPGYYSWLDQWYNYSKWRKKQKVIWRRRNRRNKRLNGKSLEGKEEE